MPKQNVVVAPSLNLPKGGGAARGISENMNINSFTGTFTFSLPLSLPSARSFSPELSLFYDSGAGNSIAGCGFSLGEQNISRLARRAIPQYDENDVFCLNDAELVLKEDSDSVYIERHQESYPFIKYFNSSGADSYWETVSSDNIISRYGDSDESRIYDPKDNTRVFKWLLTQAIDSHGNKVKYNYSKFGGTNSYLRSLEYGNYTDNSGKERFTFEVLVDYGNHKLNNLQQPDADPYLPVIDPPTRQDVFRSFKSGFEIKTEYLCRHLLVFHHFAELGVRPCLSRFMRLGFDENPHLSMLLNVEETGCARKEDLSYTTQSIPKTEFTYTRFDPETKPVYKQLQAENSKLQIDIDLADLDGEGINGMIYRKADSMLYFSPRGEGEFTQNHAPKKLPAGYSDEEKKLFLTSVNGDGTLQLISDTEQGKGYYTALGYDSWTGFKTFPASYNEDLLNYVEEADLSGTGRNEKIILESDRITYIPSLGYSGYGKPVIIKGTECVYPYPGSLREMNPSVLHTFADMFGDGLSHRVKIQSGKVSIWPTLGYGKFNKPIVITQTAPVFDKKLDLRKFMLLADVNGNGMMDIVVIHPTYLEVYFNHNGNAFSAPLRISLPEKEFFTDTDKIQLADVTGSGHLSIVCTKMGLQVKHYYYELGCKNKLPKQTGKAFLLCGISNNLGADSTIYYTSSVSYYLKDKQSKNPWLTKLHFPVQVVKQFVAHDLISGNTLTTDYNYRNGYFDPMERSFIGFGFVSHTDLSTKAGPDQPKLTACVTKQWFHLGNGMNDVAVRKEFFNGDDKAPQIPFAIYDFVNEGEATKAQALYALSGSEIRHEVYEEGVETPYSAESVCYLVKNPQVCSQKQYGVFSLFANETISLNYEQHAYDPSMGQTVVLETDSFNFPLLTCSINYPRRNPLLPEQSLFYASAEKAVVKNQDIQNARWIGIPLDERAYEISGLTLSPAKKYIDYPELKTAIPLAIKEAIAYSEKEPAGKICARLIAWSKEFYWNAGQTGILDPENRNPFPGVLLPHHSESVCFDSKVITAAFNSDRQRLADSFITQKGYVFKDEYWWTRSVITHFGKSNTFYQLQKISNDWARSEGVDPALYTEHNVIYDGYCLFLTETSQRLSNIISLRVKAEVDYRVLQPKKITDSNNNIAEVLFDALGRVVIGTSYGKEDNQPVGFQPLSFYVYKPAPNVEAILSKPLDFIQKAQSYSYYEFATRGKDGNWSPSLSLNLNATEFQTNGPGKIQKAVAYSDGFGRNIESKQWAGKVNLIDKTESENGWLTSGRVIYNAKGQVFKSYGSFFSEEYTFGADWEVVTQPLLPAPTVFTYDTLDRVIRTDTPKGFFAKSVYGVWEQRHYDENDTVIDSDYYIEFMRNHNSGDEFEALKQAADFYNTPVRTLHDALGQTVLSIEDNLGRIAPALFKPIATTTISEQAIYNNLLKNHYLVPATDIRGGAWLTREFTPYLKGFLLQLDEPVSTLTLSIQSILSEAALCTWQQYDITGRSLRSADPRFFASNLAGEKPLFNFVHHYGISGTTPLFSESADAGSTRVFSDMLGNSVKSWNALDTCCTPVYDGMQRPIALHIETAAGTLPAINQVVKRIEYGESQANALQFQLNGKIFKIYDSAGMVICPMYTYSGFLLEQTRTFRVDYKTEANWNTLSNEKLEEHQYKSSCTYDALGTPLTETQPDKSIITWHYGPLGNCVLSTLQHKGQGVAQPIVSGSTLNSDLQPEHILYGNEVKTNYSYDDHTHELKQINSFRKSGTDHFQQLIYTHDPGGLITTTRNTKQATVYHNNQEINPCTQYFYDAVYRLRKANGRLLKGLQTANAGKVKNTAIPVPSPAKTASLQQVELYTELYEYDKSNNMTTLQRLATQNYTRKMDIDTRSNKLVRLNDKAMRYDVSGQLLELPAGAVLTWNYAGNMANAVMVKRESGANDAEYYVYNHAGIRLRKVHEALISDNHYRISDKRYNGEYTVKYSGTGNSAATMKVDTEFITIAIGGSSKHDCLVQYWEKSTKDKNVDKPLFRYQHGDIIHSVAIETDESASIISYEEYSPFGETTYSWTSQNLEVSPKEFRYSAQEKDEQTGLYYYGYRYYLPIICRWTRTDPAGTIDGLNLYAFVGNNPVGNRDSMGLAKTSKLSERSTRRNNSLKGTKMHSIGYIPPPVFKGGSDIGRTINKSNSPLTSIQNLINVSNQISGKAYKQSTIRVHWKGNYDSQNQMSSGIEPFITIRSPEVWSSGQKKKSQAYSNKLTHTGIGQSKHKAEISHAIAGSMYGHNDILSAHPASVHQNTEMLAIEQGVKSLVNKGFKPKIKVTNYVHDSFSSLMGILKSSRYKIYDDKGNKVFDHVMLGDRGDIDKKEFDELKTKVKGLHGGTNKILGGKGLSGNSPALTDIIYSRNFSNSTGNPMFTNIKYGTSRYTGINAWQEMKKLY